MMRLRRASMIATLSLLAWAARASAECAFVLWETLTVIGGAAVWSQRPWEVFKRPKNVKKLQKIISCQWRSPDIATSLIENPGRGWKGRTTKGYDYMLLNRCLPDTIDPRGAEGEVI